MVESAQDADIKVPSQPWGVYLTVFLVGFVAFGAITWALGLGPFAYRQILYGTSELYILNMSDQTVTVTLDKGTPIEVKPETAERTPILGGTTTLTTRSMSGEVLETIEASVDGTPVVYSVLGERCMALSDVSSYYLGAPEPGIEVMKVFEKGTKIVELPHTRMIWPRETLRDQVKGASDGVAWLELVGCSLIAEDERHILTRHLNVLLTERKRVEQERKKADKIRREMMRGGGEAVDKMMEEKKKAGGTSMKVIKMPTETPDAGP